MDLILIIVGIFFFLIGSAISNPASKQTLKIIGAILFLVGGILFTVSFFEGYNNAVKQKQGLYK